MQKPLEGIRVLELGNFIAAPFCGTMLADMGAEVIKIEPPSGDMARAMPPVISAQSATFVALNRNKRSLVLDLKKPEAAEIVRTLAATADVFLENYRPGVLDKLGLGAEAIRAVNPGIVYTSVSGYGQTGPFRRRAAVNLIVEAASGTLSVNGEDGEMPVRPGVQTADMFGAMFATYATLAGLIGKLRHKTGRTVDVSLVESSIAVAAWETAEYLAVGTVPGQMGHRHRLNAPYQLFETSDRRYVAIGTPNTQLFQKFMTAIGLADHVSDPRFATYASRKANEEALIGLVEPAMKRLPAAEIEAALVEMGVPCGLVNNFEEALTNPQSAAREVITSVTHPVLGEMRTVRNPILFDAGGPDIRSAAPLLGQHSQEILREIGLSDARIQELAQAGVTALAAAPVSTAA
ncbi:CaiB/BaiF CoA transferase family protein [Aquabacter spiritensis]|uniref:Formyl-CoA transferase n=1 Tax=Aquabacter spiritensis TaxID=933073 RepID=A0A4R3LZ82_9HYPH|nr:CaiB/BaiF CoA-transferase family protein [Aquabacter spiritensis]TCT06061.1 formyl-CoA transferase [Aquabacter spiritensis]